VVERADWKRGTTVAVAASTSTTTARPMRLRVEEMCDTPRQLRRRRWCALPQHVA
jgi:hypothetical protein